MADAALRFRVRVSVALILAYYVVQTLVVARVDEPYPALMMPRFSWAGPLQVDGFETKEADLVFRIATVSRER